MVDDPAPTNTLPPIPFNQFSAEDQRILNPGKTVEETHPARVLPWSSNRGNLSADQVRSSREVWIRAGLSPEAYDRAAELDGHSVPNIEAEKLAREHGLQTPHARDVKFEHPNAQKHSAESTRFIQAARFQGGLGSSIIDHIAENGPKVASMSAAEQAAWTMDQEKLGLTLSGGRKNWEAAKVAAKAFLDRMKASMQKAVAT